LAVWAGVFTSIAMAFCFWRFEYGRPHAAWAVLTIGLVVLPLIGLIGIGLWQIVRGPDRLRSLGWLCLGATPVVWLGGYFTELFILAESREPLRVNAWVRMTGAWSCCVLDLQARWKYPRRTPGEHVVLIDDGSTPDAEQLVRVMDVYLELMAAILHQPMPATELAWVRGSLVGQSGRAILAWALCAHGEPAAELTPLDKHEMAHTLITMMGDADQDPPFLLVEGWAESCSADRNLQITQLADMHEAKRTYSLEELVSPDWYGTGQGPVYWEGGPLAHFLLDRFGGEKFFELYHGVRQPTFHADCQRILGTSWDELEKEFWPWVKEEAQRIQEEFNATNPVVEPDPSPTELKFAKGVDLQNWNDLVSACRSARPEANQHLPKDLAVVIELDRVNTDEEKGLVDEHHHLELRVDFVGERFWATEKTSYGTEQVLLLTDDKSAVLRLGRRGGWQGRSGGIQYAADVRAEMMSTFHMFSMFDGADNWLVPLAKWWSKDQIVLTECRRPAEGSGDPWTVTFEWQTESDPGKLRYQLELQPALEWAITKSVSEKEGERRSTSTCEYQRLGDKIVPLAAHTHFVGIRGELTTRSRWRVLSDQERQELHNYVEQVVAAGPARPHQWLRMLLSTVVVLVPVLGLSCLIISQRARRKEGDPHVIGSAKPLA
jgi:hypothetical protein